VRLQHTIEDRRHSSLNFAPRQHLAVAFVRVCEANQAARHRSEQRERVKRRDVGVVGLLAHGSPHCVA